MASKQPQFTEIHSLSTKGNMTGFANALSVWINKPHVVNRRLCGTKIISFSAYSKENFKAKLVLDVIEKFAYRMNYEEQYCFVKQMGAKEFLRNTEGEEQNHMATTQKTVSESETHVNDGGRLITELSKHNNTYQYLTGAKEDKDVKNEDIEENNISRKNDCSGTTTSVCEMMLSHYKTKSSSVCDMSETYDETSDNSENNSENERVTTDKSNLENSVEDKEINNVFSRHGKDDIVKIEGLADLVEDVIVIIRELVPKQPDRHKNIPELIVYDKSCKTCSFYPLSRTEEHGSGESRPKIEVVYQFSYNTDFVPQDNMSQEPSNGASITLSVSCASFSEDSSRKLSLTWLQGQLLPKIARWSEEPNLKTSLTSLKLVPLEEYNALYNHLKIKYGQYFAKIWPEKTDPQKYVYEDVAIATYLLLLWKQDRDKKGLTKKQSFVDLGCGNGLLVHILSSEGHPGYGVDVRKRNIWDLYGNGTVLKEMPITPSRESLFPESDWLIGNHSDELTPWIPVMAARSSYSCCYFVLPCCHYDFDCKFSQSVVGGSQYQEYLNYIQTVGENCGFVVEEDMLRIPSTKRVCFVGKERSYTEADESQMDEKRTAFINSRCNLNKSLFSNSVINCADSVKNNSHGSQWSADFEPRTKIEKTRNCVSVRNETKEAVIRSVFEKIMSSDTGEIKQLENGKSWRKGGFLPISDVVKLFDGNLLQELKSECGGIQTLLRNSSQIFQVSSGVVQLRDFTQDDPWGRKRKGKKTDNSDYVKTSLCWFNMNHPDGCPRPAELCDYAHSMEELRTRPTRAEKLTPQE